MLKKNYTRKGQACRVTFKHPNEENYKTAALVGDFNDWDIKACPMKRLKGGSFSVTASLEAAHSHSFRYLMDGDIWANDHDADGYIANEYGSDDSIITV